MNSEELEIAIRNQYPSDRQCKKWFVHIEFTDGSWLTIKDVTYIGSPKYKSYYTPDALQEEQPQNYIRLARQTNPERWVGGQDAKRVIVSDFYSPLLSTEQRSSIRQCLKEGSMDGDAFIWEGMDVAFLPNKKQKQK